MTFAEVTDSYLDYVRENCPVSYWKRQEALLAPVLTRVGEMSCVEAINTLLPSVEAKDQAFETLLPIAAAQDVIGWALRNLSPDLLLDKMEIRIGTTPIRSTTVWN